MSATRGDHATNMEKWDGLSSEERVEMQRRLEGGDSLRAIARSLGRAASTISREQQRAAQGEAYTAQAAQQRASHCRRKPHVPRKLAEPVLWTIVQEFPRAPWSPSRSPVILARAFPDRADCRVSHDPL